MNHIRKLPGLALNLLYHQFAWAYDFIAALVSLRQWTGWIYHIIPFVEGERVLELGFGTGHLQRKLAEMGISTFGLDKSQQMAGITRSRLERANLTTRLTRGLGQALPFQGQSFSCVVATFPTEYIILPETLLEIRRVLEPSGKFIIIPMAWITGTTVPEKILAWLFRFTGQSTRLPDEVIPEEFQELIAQSGFTVNTELIQTKASAVLLLQLELR